jgi:hypothetical protein
MITVTSLLPEHFYCSQRFHTLYLIDCARSKGPIDIVNIIERGKRCVLVTRGGRRFAEQGPPRRVVVSVWLLQCQDLRPLNRLLYWLLSTNICSLTASEVCHLALVPNRNHVPYWHVQRHAEKPQQRQCARSHKPVRHPTSGLRDASLHAK